MLSPSFDPRIGHVHKVLYLNHKIGLGSVASMYIKYLTYMVLNKRKLENKQTPIPFPQKKNKLGRYVLHLSPPPKRHNTFRCITEYRDQHQANELIFTPIPSYGQYFSSISSSLKWGECLGCVVDLPKNPHRALLGG